MRRSGSIRLALMGGGLVIASSGVGAVLLGPSPECRAARVAHDPQVEAICRSTSGHHGFSTTTRSHGSSGSYQSASATSHGTVTGGFGHAGAAASGS